MEILPVFDLVPGTQRHCRSAWPGPRWVHEQGVTLGQGGLVGRGSWWTDVCAEGETGLSSEPGDKLQGAW